MGNSEVNPIKVENINCYSDNYSYFVHDGVNKDKAMIVDPSEYEPIKKFLDGKKDFKISHILCTHKHWDHIGGAKKLIKYCEEKYGNTPEVIASQ